jgi:hypothetical protein
MYFDDDDDGNHVWKRTLLISHFSSLLTTTTTTTNTNTTDTNHVSDSISGPEPDHHRDPLEHELEPEPRSAAPASPAHESRRAGRSRPSLAAWRICLLSLLLSMLIGTPPVLLLLLLVLLLLEGTALLFSLDLDLISLDAAKLN